MPKAKKAAPTADSGAKDADGIMAKGKKKTKSKSEKAGLTFPISRINRYVKTKSGIKRVGGSAPIYLTAVVEYIVAEVMELAGQVTADASRKTISPEDLIKALRGDKELAKLFSGHAVFLGDKMTKVTETITYLAKKKSQHPSP